MPPSIKIHLFWKDDHRYEQLAFKFRLGLENMTTAYSRKGQVTGLCFDFPKKSSVRANQILTDNIPF